MVIVLIASGMVLLSALCVLFPQKLVDGMPYLVNSKLAKYGDIIIRILLGVSLILSADTARFPLIFTIFGYLSLAAVLAIMLLGARKVERLIKYMAGRLPIWAVRLVCVFSVFLFVFLVYGIE